MQNQSIQKAKNKSQAVANGVTQLQTAGDSSFQFEDNRPEAVLQKKLRGMANGSQNDVAQLVEIEDAQTSADMQQPNEVMGVAADATLEETQAMSADERERQVKQLMKNAEAAKDDFKALINRVVDKAGDKAQNGDPGFGHVTKTVQGAIDKAKNRMEGKTTAGLNDVLRGAIICQDMETLTKVQKILDKESMSLFKQIGAKTQKKNAFEKSDRKSAGDMVGYGDIKYIMPVLHYAASGEPDFWMYSEIQVMSEAMKGKKKEGGHSFYDITREAKPVDADGSPGFKIASTESSQGGAKSLINDHFADLKKGVNTENLATLVPKLKALMGGQEVILTQTEYNELAFAGELIYRKERVEGNLIAHGILK